MFEDWAEAIARIQRRYWELREIVGLTLGVIVVIVLWFSGSIGWCNALFRSGIIPERRCRTVSSARK